MTTKFILTYEKTGRAARVQRVVVDPFVENQNHQIYKYGDHKQELGEKLTEYSQRLTEKPKTTKYQRIKIMIS